MSADFKFKQFLLKQAKAPMKMGTDAVLLGAWSQCHGARYIVDIGTGTGIVALMLAQRSSKDTRIIGVDINPLAMEDCKANFANSPWSQRLTPLQIDILDLKLEYKADLIVSNPPYFNSLIASKSEGRTQARSQISLPHEQLCIWTSQNLAQNGSADFVLPYEMAKEFTESMNAAQLYLKRACWVKPTPSKPPKRALLSYGHVKDQASHEELTIEMERHVYTREFTELCKDFYLAL